MLGKRFIIAGGGTGGHIFPAIAIANKIKQMSPMSTFLFVGAKGKMEMEKVPQAGYEIKGLTIAGFNRANLLKNLTLPFKLIASFLQVHNIFKQFKPDAVIGVGGYSSYPVLKYAQTKRIPTFIHEANSFAGKSNIMLAKKAVKIFTGTDQMEQFFPEEKIIISGNPVRDKIVAMKVTQTEGLAHFGFSTDKKTVLCIGGSLGAKSINEAIEKDLILFDDNNLQLIWQTGKSFFERAKKIVEDKSFVFVKDFITDMDYAYSAADIVVSRSGAMAVAELCIVAKPVIFVPFPYAAEDHQTVNAKKLVDKNAAVMVEDKNASSQLVKEIIQLAENHSKQKELKQNIVKAAITNADETVANEILKHLN
jgi:UDP-N-acetylglucosamine--N-acetylmuramyl-(pentapeptide) pyrophosphoryl-undecaprenol N-acetylglucosamine transferase